MFGTISLGWTSEEGCMVERSRGGVVPNPTVLDRTAGGQVAYDLYSRLLTDRIIFLGTEVSDTAANLIVAQMLYLEQSNSEAPIHFYINSPGGSVYSGLAIYDIMQYISCPVHTYCLGFAASMGSLLLSSGQPGNRYCLPHGRIMIHQPLGGAKGQCSDIQIQAKEIQDLKNQVNAIYVHHCSGKVSEEDIEKLTDRDNFLGPQEAIEMGLIDEVIKKSK